MTTTIAAREVDPDRLDAFIGRVIGDVGATLSAGLVVLGDRLGLYRALADGDELTAEGLAERAGVSITYVRPWLANQAAGGYVEYDAEHATYSMTPEQAFTLAIPDSPAFFAGSMQLALGVLHDVPALEDRFRTGAGFGWHEHDHNLFEGTERFFRPGYVANLVSTWLPALDGVVAKLERGARRRRRRLWSWRVDDPDGRGLPGVHLPRRRLPRGLDHRRPPPRGRGRSR